MKSFMLVATNYVNFVLCFVLLMDLELLMSDLILSLHVYKPEPVHIGEPANVVPLPRNSLCEIKL